MLHRFVPHVCSMKKQANFSNSNFIPLAGARGLGAYAMWEQWRQCYGIPDKFPRWGVFSKEWQETACQVAALRKAEKAPIPPDPEEN